MEPLNFDLEGGSVEDTFKFAIGLKTADSPEINGNGQKLYVYPIEVNKFNDPLAGQSKIFEQNLEIDWEKLKNPDMVMDQIFGPPEWLDALCWISLKNDIQEWKRVVFKNSLQFSHFEK